MIAFLTTVRGVGWCQECLLALWFTGREREGSCPVPGCGKPAQEPR